MLNRRQIVASCATIALIAIAIGSVAWGGFNLLAILLCGLGVGMGAIYICNRGATPKWLKQGYNIIDLGCGGAKLHDDDDHRNLPLRIYLPALLLIVAIGWWFLMPVLMKSSVGAFHPLRFGWVALVIVLGTAVNVRSWRIRH
jgi:hypothetical protein